MTTFETQPYKVKKGDCLWNITKNQGFPAKDWEKIYKASYNAKFRKLRPDPNRIEPGDVFMMPKFSVGDIQSQKKKVEDYGKQLAVLGKSIEKLHGAVRVIKTEQDLTDKTLQDLQKKLAQLQKDSRELHKKVPGDPGLPSRMQKIQWDQRVIDPVVEQELLLLKSKSSKTKVLAVYKKRVEDVRARKAEVQRAYEMSIKELELMLRKPY